MRHHESEIFLPFSKFKMATLMTAIKLTLKDQIHKYFACYIILQLF